jgi:hypothetical protein
LRVGLPLLSVKALRLLPFRPCLPLDGGGLDLRLFSLLSLLSLRSGLRLDRSLGLGRSGRRGRRRLNLCRSRAAMSAFALVRPGLPLLRIRRPVLMFAAFPIVRLRHRGRRTRNQNGNSGPNKTSFHEITQSMNGGLQIISALELVSQLRANRRQEAAHFQGSGENAQTGYSII